MAVETEDLSALEELWKTHSTSAAGDGVYATLRTAIAQGLLKPGDRLTEETIAHAFGISRTPVREAVLRLEAERFATRVPRRGLVVRSMSEQEVLDFYEIRIGLDGIAARLAVAHAQPGDRAQLRWVNQQLADAARRGEPAEALAKLSDQFHRMLYQATHNSLMVELTSQIEDKFRRFSESTFHSPGWAERVVRDHERMLDAIDAGDAAAAERIAQEHKTTSREVRMSMLHDRAPREAS